MLGEPSNEPDSEVDDDKSPKGLDRRRLIKRGTAGAAAAWVAPIVYDSFASPAAAATSKPGTYTYTIAQSGTQLEIASGRTITYTVIGGGGAGGNDRGAAGGAGTKLEGSFTTTAYGFYIIDVGGGGKAGTMYPGGGVAGTLGHGAGGNGGSGTSDGGGSGGGGGGGQGQHFVYVEGGGGGGSGSAKVVQPGAGTATPTSAGSGGTSSPTNNTFGGNGGTGSVTVVVN